MINIGRQSVADSLSKVISEFFGKNEISEQTIKEAWLEEIAGNNRLTYNGWYSPPEFGMAVLASHGDDMRRTHFKSFRDPMFFSSNELIDWSASSLTAYASNVDLETGLPADFATTMYFGDQNVVKNHLSESISACQTLFTELNEISVGRDLYVRLKNILGQHGIDGRTWSSTDNDFNFGHTLPKLDVKDGLTDNTEKSRVVITDAGAEVMRTERVFLSSEASLDLTSGTQFTVEPQCVSKRVEGLPKVMMHYVVQFLDGKFQVCDVCENLPRRYGLL